MATDHIEAGIQDITGVGTATAQFISSAQKFVVASVPKNLLAWATTETVSGSHGGDDSPTTITLPVGTDNILSVRRDAFVAEQVPPEMRGFIDNSASLYHATATYPKYYIAAGNEVRVKPDPTSSKTAHAQYVDYSKIDDASDLRNAVIFRASSNEFTKLAMSAIPSWSDVTVPITPGVPSFGNDLSIASNSPVVPTITAASVDSSGWSNPNYTKPVFSSPTLESVGSLTLPSVPSSPVLNTSTVSFSETVPTYTKPVISLTTLTAPDDLTISSILPVAPDGPSFDTGALASTLVSTPGYVKPSFSAPTLETVNALTLPSKPIAPSSPSFTYTDASADDIIRPIVSISDMAALDVSAPSYTKPVMALTSFPDQTWTFPSVVTAPVFSAQTVADFSTLAPTYTQPIAVMPVAPTITDLDVSVLAPMAPAIQTIAYQDGVVADAVAPNEVDVSAHAPTYTKPIVSLPTFPTISWTLPSRPVASSLNAQTSSSGGATVDLSQLGTIPTYTAPVMNSPDFADTEKWITTEEDPEMNIARVQTIQAQISEYQARLQESQGNFAQESVEYQAKLQIALQNAAQANSGDTTLLQGHSNAVQLYTQEIQGIVGANQGQIAEWQQESTGLLQQYQGDVQNELNVFNKDTARYQTEYTEATTKANQDMQVALDNMKKEQAIDLKNKEQTMQALIADNQSKMGVYQANLQNYQTQVTKEVQEFEMNLRGDLEVWSTERQTILQQYQADIQNNLNSFNKENIIYQATIGEKIKEADLSDRNEARKLEKFQAEIGNYQAEVGKVVQGNTAQIAEWQQKNTIELQKYASDLQNELNKFNASNIEYQEDIQRKAQNLAKDIQEAVQNAQNEIAVNSANLQKDIQIVLQNALQDYQQDVQEYNAEVQKYSAELTGYQAEVGAAIQEWTAEEWTKKFSKYQNDYASLLQTYQTDIQNELNVFNKDTAVFQFDLQERIQEATNLQTKDAQEYSSKLQKYASELQSYQADVAAQVQEYTVNEIQKEIAIWNTDVQSDLQKYATDIQNELNVFQKESVSYQAQLNISLKDADLSDAADSKKVSLYQNDLASYQAEVGSVVQKWTQEEWTQKFGVYQADYTALLQEYQANIQNELNEFNKETAIYQAAIQQSIQDAQLESAEEAQKIQIYASELNQYTQDINKEVQDYTNTLAKEVQEYQSKVALYTADLQKYQGEVASEAQKTALNSQKTQIYEKEAEKYYAWATAEIQMYTQNNSRMMGMTMAAQQQAAQQ